jgi:hypothetical protein
MIHFGRKWLTGELYRDMSHEGARLTLERTSAIMSEFRQAQSQLERACSEVVMAR